MAAGPSLHSSPRHGNLGPTPPPSHPVPRAAPRAKVRLGWLGPAIVGLGAAVAGLGIWFMQSVRPIAGEVIDTVQMDANRSLVLRKELKSDRSFIELHDGPDVKWQALIPHYAGSKGRPAVAWSDRSVTVRVERDGRAEVFAFALNSSAKLGAYRIAVEHEPITTQPQGPITLTDHDRAYELVGGVDWHQVVAVDILKGGGVWKAELGREPVTGAGVERGQVWVEQTAKRRSFDAVTGREINQNKPLN